MSAVGVIQITGNQLLRLRTLTIRPRLPKRNRIQVFGQVGPVQLFEYTPSGLSGDLVADAEAVAKIK